MNSSTIEDARDKWRRRSGPFAIAFAAWLGWALAAILLILRLGEPGMLLALLLLGGLLFFSLAVLLLVIRREIWRQRRNDLGQMQRENLQMQELVWLSSRVSPRRPLPFPLYKTGYEARLDVLNAAWELIEQERPKRVLELGSGLSSLVMAYALEANGQGTLQSLEDSAGYADITRKLLAEHGLSDRAQVIEAPLGPVEIDQETHKWYTLTDLRLDEPIDFLFVDGPAKILGNIIRYPAIPVLGQRLADKAFIILDDTHREQERLIVQRWLDENPEIRVVDCERCRNSGFAILHYSRLRNNS